MTIYQDGSLEIHIIRRKADFQPKTHQTGSKSLEGIQMPKMTQSYLEQAKFECENAHEIFHRLGAGDHD